MSEATFTTYRAFAAEGARVGIFTCEMCGAALLLDPSQTFDVGERHAEWHHREARNGIPRPGGVA